MGRRETAVEPFPQTPPLLAVDDDHAFQPDQSPQRFDGVALGEAVFVGRRWLDQGLGDAGVRDDKEAIIEWEHVHEIRVGLVESVPDLDEAVVRVPVERGVEFLAHVDQVAPYWMPGERGQVEPPVSGGVDLTNDKADFEECVDCECDESGGESEKEAVTSSPSTGKHPGGKGDDRTSNVQLLQE